MSSDRRNAAILIALTALLFADVLFLGRGFYRGDLFIYHFPMKKVVRELTLSEGLPQWNPFYQGGQPLAANPAYELFYPPQWLVLLPWYAFAFQLHIVVHFAIAAVGMYLLLRELNLRAPAALFGACAFAFGAPYLSLMIRLPFLFAMTWMPLVLLFTHRAIARRRMGDVALGALFFGMQAILGEPVTVFQTGALAGSYALYRWLEDRDWRGVARVALLLVWGLVIAAVQLVPAVDHARDSVRSEGFRWEYASNWSTPPSRLAELAFPRLFRALHDDTNAQAIRKLYPSRVEPFIPEIYPGLLIAIAALAALLRGMPGRWYALAVVAMALLLALGSHAPLFRILYDVGLVRSIRYPEKFLLTALFVIIVAGAAAVDRFASDAKLRQTAFALGVTWVVVALAIWASGSRSEATPQVAEARALPWNAYWMMNVARGAAVLALVRLSARNARWWAAALVAFAIADASFIHFADAARTPRSYFDEPRAAHGIAGREQFRLFHQAAWDEWDGSPLAMSHFLSAPRTDAVMRDAMFPFSGSAFGFRGLLEQDLDQTSLLVTEAYEKTAQDVRQRGGGGWNPWFLQSANVRWVAQFVNVDEAQRRGSPVEIRDIGPHPRYWFASRLWPGREAIDVADHVATQETAPGDAFTSGEVFAPAAGQVVRVEEHPSHVMLDVESAGRAYLVSANTMHKYWRAAIDGHSAPVIPTNVAFQGVVVPAGRHRVELTYRNPRIIPSAIVSALTLLAALAAVAYDRWR
ncbi:MAG TPA: hypothetical protein VF824_06940 [Thermoanaerobaculia bacterium]